MRGRAHHSGGHAGGYERVVQLEFPLGPLDATTVIDLKRIEREPGSHGAIALLGRDGRLYYCKGPTLRTDHARVGVNEMIANALAARMNIPVRSCRCLRWQDDLFVGTEYLRRKMSGPLTATTWRTLRNAPTVAYPLVVLDVWLLNDDRHGHNWLGAVFGDGTGLFLASDHDRALFGTDRDLVQLRGSVYQPITVDNVRCAVIRDAISDQERLDEALRRAELIDNAELRSLLAGVPEQWLRPDEVDEVLEFLAGRRDNLRRLFSKAANVFPKLRGG